MVLKFNSNLKNNIMESEGDNRPEGSSQVDYNKTLSSIHNLKRQLDYATSMSDTIENLFTSEMLSRRTKLKDLCMKLILELSSNVLHVRDKLWRSYCYEVLCRCKKLKKGKYTPSQLLLIKNHLNCGIGQFTYMLLKIQESEMFKKLNPRINCVDVCQGYMRSSAEPVPADKWFEELLYYSILNIGDLYRYFTDIFGSDDEQLYWKYYNLAQENYTKAFFLNPNYGMAHNQLGNLNLNINNGLDSTFYMLYSMMSPIPYEGSCANLRQLLEKQLVDFARVSACKEWKPIDSFVFSMLTVVHQFLFEPLRAGNIEKMSKDVLLHLPQILSAGDIEENIYFRIALITIMTVWRLQSVDSTKVSTAVALAMGVFFQLTEHLLLVLEDCAEEVEVTEYITYVDVEDEYIEDVVDGTNNEETIIPSKPEKPSKTPVGFGRRRRRARLNSVDRDSILYSSDEEDGPSTVCSDSDGEDYILEMDSSGEAEPSTSESEGTKAKFFISPNAESELGHLQDDIIRSSASASIEETKITIRLNMLSLMDKWSKIEPFLVALIPLQLWLQTSGTITDVFARNCEKVFLGKFCKIINLLQSIEWELYPVLGKYRQAWDKLKSGNHLETFMDELPEDRSMLGLGQFKSALINLKITELGNEEQMMTRVARHIKFGHWLCETNLFALLYTEEDEFVVPTPGQLRRHIQENKMNQLIESEDANNLSNLWRDRNPRRKERNNRRRRQTQAKLKSTGDLVFVFIDLPAALNHLNIIKHIANHPKFVIVFPHSVCKKLDILKETEEEGSEEARTISRWIEHKSGYNEFRTICEHDKRKIKTTYPLDFTPETGEYFDVLEDCNFLQWQELKGLGRPHHNFFGDVRDKYRLFYLTGHKTILDDEDLGFNPIEAARSTDVFVDYITSYSVRRGRRRRPRNGKSNG